MKRDFKRRQVIERFGGASRDRTDDLIVANDALSQLSYSPTCEEVEELLNLTSHLAASQFSEHACSAPRMVIQALAFSPQAR